jgi:membrane-bound serine protease (ClpP class)
MARWLVTLVLVAGLVGTDPAVAADGTGRVLVTSVEGPITPVIADHLDDGVDRAERDGFAAFVVRLDTPGGLDTSMRRIIRRFLAAEVPVVVFVGPPGARAASAGALITLAANVAVMAPGTAIGASTPVDVSGGDVGRKAVNDAAALAASVARARGRNEAVARAFVTEARSLPAEEALRAGVVDAVAPSLEAALRAADGRSVRVSTAGREVVLRTAGAPVEEYRMGLVRRVLQRLADPNLAVLFLSLGVLALLGELASPGIGVSGVTGVILLLLGLAALSVLPVNVAGVLLLLVAVALFVAELLAPGVGLAALGGSVALVLGAIFLADDIPGRELRLAVVVPVAVLVGGGVVVAGRFAARSRRTPSSLTGTARFVGREVVVGRADDRRGQALVEGTWWRLRSTGAPLAEGEVVRVVAVEGLELVVEPAASSSGSHAGRAT